MMKTAIFISTERKEKLLQENHLQIQQLKDEADRFEAHWKEVHDSEVQECRKRMQKLQVESTTCIKTSPRLHNEDKKGKEAGTAKMAPNSSAMALHTIGTKAPRTSAFMSSTLASTDATLQKEVASQMKSSAGESDSSVCEQEKTATIHTSTKLASSSLQTDVNPEQTSTSVAAESSGATDDMPTPNSQARDGTADVPGTNSTGGARSDPPLSEATERGNGGSSIKEVAPPRKSVRFQLPGEEQ